MEVLEKGTGDPEKDAVALAILGTGWGYVLIAHKTTYLPARIPYSSMRCRIRASAIFRVVQCREIDGIMLRYGAGRTTENQPLVIHPSLSRRQAREGFSGS